jgi:transposase InsO family protein
MRTHPRAKLGLAARHELCLAIERGLSIRAAARLFNVSPATAHKHWHRWLANPSERRTLRCLEDRSSRPLRSPRMLPAAAQERICEARRHTGWGPRLIAGVTGHPHSTVHRTLARHGISRPPRPERSETVRYEWPCPGDLLHMDTKRYARFERPGHRVTGVRDKTGAEKRALWGYEFAHSIVDDRSRVAYSELHPDQRAPTVAAFTRRALSFFEALGICPKRLMTDNAFVYTRSRELRELLAERGVRHLTIEPRRPQTNGKVERFQQTMAREWAYGLTYRSSDDRARALPHWLDYYNRCRPHSGIGDRPPISRVHDVSGQDT